MLSSPVFRYAKPDVVELRALLPVSSVVFHDTPFTDTHTMAPMNRGLFDVISADGHTLNRAEGFNPDYWFAGGELVVRVPGNYTLRVFETIQEFEGNVIPVGRQMRAAEGGAFLTKIPFWPQILSQPETGVARVSNDGQHVAFVSQGTSGQVSFAYRLVNAYGQVSEPACVYVTSV